MEQVLVSWLIALLVGIGEFAHGIAGSGEVLAAVMPDAEDPRDHGPCTAAAPLGNVVGGGVVTCLDYGQVCTYGPR